MKSGFIAILGRPNAGKSSLTNALVGEKVSIVTPKAQTTRDKILGISSGDGYQMVFIDTPGVHEAKNRLGEYMGSQIKKAGSGADAAVIVLDSTKRLLKSDLEFIEGYLRRKNLPVYIVVNKVDVTGYEGVYPILQSLSVYMNANSDLNAVKEIIPLSAKRGDNVEVLKEALKKELKEGPAFYDSDIYTDKSERFMICEIIREKALFYLQDEIPHGVAVCIQTMKDEKNLASIEADIICEKTSHKPIIIGDEGTKIREIGEKSRYDIEKLLGKKVFLKLFVKVREDWRNKRNVLNDAGYEDNN